MVLNAIGRGELRGACGAEPAVVVPCPCAVSDAECATRNQPPRCVVFGCLSILSVCAV